MIHLAATYGHQAAAQERVDPRLLHRGRADLGLGHARAARLRARRGPGRGARSRSSWTASPTTCARTRHWPRSSASRACRSSCSTAATAFPAPSRPRCCSVRSNALGKRRLASTREDAPRYRRPLRSLSHRPLTPPPGSR